MKNLKNHFPAHGILMLLMFISSTGFIHAQTTTWKAPESASKIENPLAGNDTDIKAGKKIYNQFCAVCHGNKGKGDGMAGMSLNPRPSNFYSDAVKTESDGALFWKISEGRAPMASYKSVLTEEQRWKVISYIREISKK